MNLHPLLKHKIAGAIILIVSILSPVGSVGGGAGLAHSRWGDANFTVSKDSYKYSDMSAFVQALINSNGCDILVDGIFGDATAWELAVMQNGILGFNNGGIMTPSMWNNFYYADSPYGRRLINYGISDAYGTQMFGYYGGHNHESRLGWNPFASQWLFSPTPVSNPHYLIAADYSRTSMSYGACS